MARALNKLSARAVATLRTPGRHGDGGGLYLAISADGTRRRWVFLYTLRGQRREMGLGAVADVSLAEAREKAMEARRIVKAGTDPIAAREATKAATRATEAAERAIVTFGAFADAYVDRMSPAWRNETHREQWRTTLRVHAAVLRDMPIDGVDTDAVLRVLEPIWNRIPETAARLRGRIENVLDAAKVRGLRTGENPARWRGHLRNILPKRQRLTRGHHAAMPFAQVPSFLSALRARQSTAARALEFCILTAARTGEVLGAQWDEFDLDAAIWTVPATRMKAQREHRVPLCARAVVVIREMALARMGAHVFPGHRASGLSNMAMAKALEASGQGAFTVHGFRSSFRDWAAEATSFPSDICEMALAHTIGNKVEAAYRRGDLFNRRRELMEAWGRYCADAERGVIRLVDLPKDALRNKIAS
ncbi:MAG TPA: integrase arm-type DNA-binding domain-containing protein [Hyphomicrobiaceae bacterium]|nr:integrase arm-type DNA-binding domain-containing protein [Hyphomicrobiaceae bacterium]